MKSTLKEFFNSKWAVWVLGPLLGIIFGMVLVKSYAAYRNRPNYSQYVGKGKFKSSSEYLSATHLIFHFKVSKDSNGKIVASMSDKTVSRFTKLISGSEQARILALNDVTQINDLTTILKLAQAIVNQNNWSTEDTEPLARLVEQWNAVPGGSKAAALFGQSTNPVLQGAYHLYSQFEAKLASPSPSSKAKTTHKKAAGKPKG